jgi:mRNA degradation ribonuclease J1/J2
MVYITLYGGVGEIGGNIVLLEDLDNRASILLDFGRNFPTQARYYSFPQKPRSSVQLELIKTGLIPSIRDANGSNLDVYAELDTKEILRPYKAKGQKLRNLKRSEVYYTIREPQTPCSISDLFVTHCHSDHVGLAPILRRDMTINMGEATHLLYRAYHQAAAKDSIENKLYLTEEDLNARERVNQPRHTYRTFHSGAEIATQRGDLTVVPYAVDHSAPGAYSFLIHSSSGLIV